LTRGIGAEQAAGQYPLSANVSLAGTDMRRGPDCSRPSRFRLFTGTSAHAPHGWAAWLVLDLPGGEHRCSRGMHTWFLGQQIGPHFCRCAGQLAASEVCRASRVRRTPTPAAVAPCTTRRREVAAARSLVMASNRSRSIITPSIGCTGGHTPPGLRMNPLRPEAPGPPSRRGRSRRAGRRMDDCLRWSHHRALRRIVN
jgi:hypothetical protein